VDIAMIRRAAAWAGLDPLGDEQLAQLAEYEAWLASEAVAAGGIGPREASRLTSRHTADALTLATACRDLEPTTALDLGSGVGLPGLPLAIAMPATRCRLTERAVRVLGLENVTVEMRDLTRPRGVADFVVSRAAMPADLLGPILPRWTAEGGVAAVAGSTTGPLQVAGYTLVEVPPEILDHPGWILIMARPRGG
jgi:16S rRNA (guanine527-N7)-methyltransferase